MDRPSAEALDALLPQTQCTRCGYAGCRPYAEAMAAGEAGPNRCPPGGPSTLLALSAALGVPATAVDPACGAFGAPQVAVIDEAACIGCAKCLPACPVDAILGARKFMHTVITANCNGCELCIAPCPVDCITLVPTGAPPLSAGQLAADAARYRARYTAHRARGEQREAKRTSALAARADRLRALAAGSPDATP
jgi:Na+-translocating ferredoxin:NAD+ oxidoreductase subunit B